MLKVGDVVWLFDFNRRKYAADRRGGPIFREHFFPVTIDSETAQSWVVDGRKVNKRTMTMATSSCGPGFSTRVYASQAEVDDACWVEDARPRLSRAVDRCYDAAILRKIDALLGAQKGTPT
jgi:hypothetical protein